MAARRKAAGATARTRSTASASSRAEPIVIYVHGIGDQDPKAELKLAWDLALFGKDFGARSRMAYWADILRPSPPPPSAAKATGPKSKTRRAAADDKTLDLAAILARHGLDGDAPATLAFAAELAGHLGVDGRLAAGGTVGKKILPLPGFLRRPISRIFLESFIADTAAYFFKRETRRRIRERLQ
ncbi:MAG: hypothetical protein FJX57_15955, partial [Alphaproteobacteria bacterium]|nr:hypothetical protein [Alphaproteobacteria bacterium]